MTLTLYTFRDGDDNEASSYSTQNYQEAKEYASKCKFKVIANEFEFYGSEQVDDFTGNDETDEEEA